MKDGKVFVLYLNQSIYGIFTSLEKASNALFGIKPEIYFASQVKIEIYNVDTIISSNIPTKTNPNQIKRKYTKKHGFVFPPKEKAPKVPGRGRGRPKKLTTEFDTIPTEPENSKRKETKKDKAVKAEK
jgi:hypothetical protein